MNSTFLVSNYFILILVSSACGMHEKPTKDFTEVLSAEVVAHILTTLPLNNIQHAARFITLVSVNRYFYHVCFEGAYQAFKHSMNVIIQKLLTDNKVKILLNTYNDLTGHSVVKQRFCHYIVKNLVYHNPHTASDHYIDYVIKLISQMVHHNATTDLNYLIKKKFHWLHASLLFPHFYTIDEQLNPKNWYEWRIWYADVQKINSLALCIIHHKNHIFKILFKLLRQLTTLYAYDTKTIVDVLMYALTKAIQHNNVIAFKQLARYLISYFSCHNGLDISFVYDKTGFFHVKKPTKTYQLKDFLYLMLSMAQHHKSNAIQSIIEEYMKIFFDKQSTYIFRRYIDYQRLKIIKKV